MLSCPYFVKKFVNSVKDYTILWAKNTLLSCPIWSKKRQFCQNCSTILTKKSQKDAYFLLFRFLRKKSLLSCSFFVNKRQFSKKTLLSCLYFVKKRLSLENLVLTCHFSQFFYEKPPALSHICSKTSILSKLHNIMAQKNSIGYHFF